MKTFAAAQLENKKFLLKLSHSPEAARMLQDDINYWAARVALENASVFQPDQHWPFPTSCKGD